MRLLGVVLAAALALTIPAPSGATVLTTTRSVTYSPSTPTTVFSITFPFLSATHIVVVKTTISNGAETTLTQGINYSVTLPVGSTNGYITTTASVTSTHRITISRSVPYTQPTSFRTSGTFNPKNHEDSFDRLTMQVQQLSAGAAGNATLSDIEAAVEAHDGEADPHTGYALLAGRSGGQTLRGGNAASNNLTISSTSNATKGKINLGSASAYDESSGYLGIGTTAPSAPLEVVGVALTDFIVATDSEITNLNTTDGVVDNSLEVGGTLGVIGESTFSDNVHISNGYLNARHKIVTFTVASPANLSFPNDCGNIYTTAEAATFELPTANSDPDFNDLGCSVTIFNLGVDGTAVAISVQTGDGVEGSCVGVTGAGSATVVEFSGVAGKGVLNGANANKGDHITFTNIAGNWYASDCVGEWASEP